MWPTPVPQAQQAIIRVSHALKVQTTRTPPILPSGNPCEARHILPADRGRVSLWSGRGQFGGDFTAPWQTKDVELARSCARSSGVLSVFVLMSDPPKLAIEIAEDASDEEVSVVLACLGRVPHLEHVGLG